MAHYVLFIAWLSLLLLNIQNKENIICNHWSNKQNTQRGNSFPHLEPQQKAEFLSALHAVLGKSAST